MKYQLLVYYKMPDGKTKDVGTVGKLNRVFTEMGKELADIEKVYGEITLERVKFAPINNEKALWLGECPSCGQELLHDHETGDYVCSNPTCSYKKKFNAMRACSRCKYRKLNEGRTRYQCHAYNRPFTIHSPHVQTCDFFDYEGKK